MALRISTISSTVSIDDLGIILTHPTVNYNLTDYFTAIELKESEDLTNAIQAGNLSVDDGTNFIHKDDYVSDEVILQDIGIRKDIRFVSEDELAAGFKTTYSYLSVFPLAVNSTASVTRNIYIPTARFITWIIKSGDILTITGSSVAGTYTVESITDQQNLIIVESISNSTGGNIEIFHPAAATRIGVDPTNIDWSSSSNLQTVLDDLVISNGSGINNSDHRNLDQLVHLIAEDSYEEFTYSPSSKITNITTWTNSSKVTKIREEQFTYISNKINILVIIQYNLSGIEVERITETYNYSGNKIQTIDRIYI